MLKEAWESNAQGDKNVVSHVLLMRERMEKMASLVQKNVKQAQTQQKHWYDQTAQQREFVMGDQVLLLLPTSTSKLMAQWQGPYQIVKAVCQVNYMVDMQDKRERYRTFHVNMLHKWHTPVGAGYLSQ